VAETAKNRLSQDLGAVRFSTFFNSIGAKRTFGLIGLSNSAGSLGVAPSHHSDSLRTSIMRDVARAEISK